MSQGELRAILLQTEQIETYRSIRLLDLIKPYDTHKIGVLYVRKGQKEEKDILSNSFGSLRYIQFLYVRFQILFIYGKFKFSEIKSGQICLVVLCYKG